ncbi:MAG: hypothetical protein Q8L88_15985 [Bacteroidota bacterium]|nr:hypothetical protein [Bacteroidota bacterium]
MPSRLTRSIRYRFSIMMQVLSLRSIRNFFLEWRMMNKIAIAFSRGAVTINGRETIPTDPLSWEFSSFSQNGEDGIFDYLTHQISNPNRYFIEIGASDGTENNCSWLALGRKFSGLMIDGNETKIENARTVLQPLNWGLQFIAAFITLDNILEILKKSLHTDPDVFSLDMDGNDYYIAKKILDDGMRPKIFCVEYNSAYGPNASLTIMYDEHFDYNLAHKSHLYYGVSIAGWKNLFNGYGYKFVTVDSNGVNAFFVHADAFPQTFINGLQGSHFRENFAQRVRFEGQWDIQFSKIKEMHFFEIPK